jgi:hypothetical protein
MQQLFYGDYSFCIREQDFLLRFLEFFLRRNKSPHTRFLPRGLDTRGSKYLFLLPMPLLVGMTLLKDGKKRFDGNLKAVVMHTCLMTFMQ